MAWAPGNDPRELCRRLHTAYDGFVAGRSQPAGVRQVVLDSWLRSRSSGIDPDATGPPVDLTDAALEAYRTAHPLARVMPVIRSLLVADARDNGFIVAVTDAEGRILWLEGESRLRSRAVAMHFVEGAVWREDVAGTNAPGTALALDHPVQVFAAEHFRRTVQPWSCSAAPLHDPAGRVIGAIDVTGGDAIAAPQVLTLVRAAARAAESELRIRSLAEAGPTVHRHRRTAVETQPDGHRLQVLGRDTACLTVGGGAPGRTIDLSLRHAELLLLLTEHPAGRTAAQLATDLHEYDTPPVTVRAELCRLRGVLGHGALSSRPYRLAAPIHTDLTELRRLLHRGSHRQALDLYAGPVLPRSLSPAILSIREQTRRLLRDTMLHRANLDLLLRYAESDEALADAEVWRACVARLPRHAPRRTAALSHLSWLDADFGTGAEVAVATSLQPSRA